MARKLALLTVVASLACLGVAPNAGAVGLANHRVAPEGNPAANSLIAPVGVCAGQNRVDAPARAQHRTMRCMTDFARRGARLARLAETKRLERSARDKSEDILRCDSFSHSACGRDFTYWMRMSGYLSAPCWKAGENLAWGIGEAGTPGAIFRAWMRSPGHRRNILGRFSQVGVSLRVGDLGGREGVHVWTQHFGSHCSS